MDKINALFARARHCLVFLLALNINCVHLEKVVSANEPNSDDRRPNNTSSISDLAEEPIWSVVNPDTHFPCIQLQGSVEFSVLPGDHFGTDVIKVPREATATGTCTTLGRDYQDIKLSWNTTIAGYENVTANSIYFGFITSWESEFSELSITSKEYAVSTITVEYPGKSDHVHLVYYSVSDFLALSTPRNRSYSCSNGVLQKGYLRLKISNFQFLAFNENANSSILFDNKFVCGADTDGNQSTWYHIASGFEWFFIGFFAFCLVGSGLVLMFGIFNKRHEIIEIGYRIVGAR